MRLISEVHDLLALLEFVIELLLNTEFPERSLNLSRLDSGEELRGSLEVRHIRVYFDLIRVRSHALSIHTGCIGLGLLTGLSFLFSLSDDLNVPLLELLQNLSMRRRLTLHPRVLEEFGNRRSVHGVVLKHGSDEHLELLGEESSGLVLRMDSPEAGLLVVGYGSEERILLHDSQVERRALRDHDEQDDAQREQVHLSSVVRLLLVNLRSHVVGGAELRGQVARAISTGKRASESKVSQLEVELVVEQQVLGLQVSMSHSHAMAVVEAFESLSEVVSGHRLSERTRVGYEVKQLSTSAELEGNVIDGLFARWLLINTLFEFNLLQNVGMSQLLHDSNLFEY